MADYAATGLPPAYLPTHHLNENDPEHGLKWNPFSPELPIEALFITPKLKTFIWRIEQNQVREGGFALITEDPGTGKSVVLRLLAERPPARSCSLASSISWPPPATQSS